MNYFYQSYTKIPYRQIIFKKYLVMWEIVFSFGYYLKPHIMTQREKILKLNLQINQQLKRAGCLNGKGKIVNPLSNFPDTEWKIWITELIEIRNNIESQLN